MAERREMTVRFDEAERAALAAFADDNCVTLAAAMRILIRRHLIMPAAVAAKTAKKKKAGSK